MIARYPLCADAIGDEEIEVAIACLRSKCLTMGDRVAEFEEAFARRVGAKHAVMVNSGSSANLIAVAALRRWVPLSDVLVPAVAWSTTASPAMLLGSRAHIVDVNETDMSANLDSCREHDRADALMLVHVLGTPADLDAVAAYRRERGVHLIEDCCESLGAKWHDKHVGTSGFAGTFSLYYSHHLTTIEGGVVVTDNQETTDDLRSLRAHGWTRDRSDRATWATRYPDHDDRFLFVMPGYNVRPTEVQAAIGLVQLPKLDAAIEGRMRTAARVMEIARCAPCASALHPKDGAKSTWMAVPFLVDEGVSRRVFCAALESAGVETRPIVAGNLARHPMWRGRDDLDDLPHADAVWKRGFMVGCLSSLTSEGEEALAAGFKRAAEVCG